ncbi:hypothetical protein CYFUS_000615 [Cystobacter fuscus]|uniref:Uncharacterized protein n=1 Tax=Cystobacter fuscus TaxID=43 RepID=A0A250IVC7_9BACT|nr:hypothetical protein [Cystobacter fuscus]ATB35203.1 hypothetical protein CYFUS_000615 [Cystobacter fuscus]
MVPSCGGEPLTSPLKFRMLEAWSNPLSSLPPPDARDDEGLPGYSPDRGLAPEAIAGASPQALLEPLRG